MTLSTIGRLFVAGLLLCTVARADETDRLVTLGDVWYSAKLFHPYLAYSQTDWDKALVQVIPAVRAARTPGEHASAVQQLLETLHDPMTGVVHPASSSREEWYQVRTESDVVIITLKPGHNDAPTASEQDIAVLSRSLMPARAVVFDLRSRPEEAAAAFGFANMIERLIRTLCVAAPIPGPYLRERARSNIAPETADFHLRRVYGQQPAPEAKDRRLVLICNRYSVPPRNAVVLQRKGQAGVIFEGEGVLAVPGSVSVLNLEAGYRVYLRTSETIDADGSGIGEPVARVTAEDAMRLALEYARKPGEFPFTAKRPPAVPDLPLSEEAYASMRYPPAEYRLLAAFRVCGALKYFFAYPHLQERRVGDLCRAHIPALLNASGELEYHLAAARMVADVNDSHASIQSTVLDAHFGTARPPLVLQWIEDEAVVTQVGDNLPGIRPGDVVLRIDGEETTARIERLRPYVAGSTPHSRMYRILQVALMGAQNSLLDLEIAGADGVVRKAPVQRLSTRPIFLQAAERRGEVVRILEDGIGYVDLDRLQQSDVDTMFDKLRDTRAIVFDMRGFPQASQFDLAPRLTDRDEVPVGFLIRRFWHSLPGMGTERERGDYVIDQVLPSTDKWRYRGKTIMLIDERAISAAEHSALCFSTANGTRFVGSATAGAGGGWIGIVLPGAITVRSSGYEYRYRDGRYVEGIGVLPDVPVSPTIAGIRAGRDEVLDRAVQYLVSGK